MILALLFTPFFINHTKAQNNEKVTLDLTLEQAIELAHKQSLSSFRAKNMYLSSYWEFRSFKADRLPSLSLSTNPIDFNRSVESDYLGKDFEEVNRLTSSGELIVRQNFTPTGGVFTIRSSLQRLENMGKSETNLVSSPILVGFQQSLNGYNSFRWQSRIEPLKFEQAKKTYLQSLENVAISAIDQFFNVVTAEIGKLIAETNYSNADTLYRIGRGRFEIGTVTQDELLDLELGLLNAEISRAESEIQLRQSNTYLNSFLGIPDDIVINCIVPFEIPSLKIDIDKALAYALENNPDILEYERLLLNAGESVARTRSQTGLNASLNANIGINKRTPNDDIATAYQAPFDEQQRVGISLNVPIIDWGYRKGRIQMAKASQEETEFRVEQNRIAFEQGVINNVLNFNLQEKMVSIAAKADTIAQMGFDVTKQRFMIDKVDVIRLNSARNSLDAARRAYYSALKTYWTRFYTIRQLTLYDFLNDRELIQELDDLLQKR